MKRFSDDAEWRELVLAAERQMDEKYRLLRDAIVSNCKVWGGNQLLTAHDAYDRAVGRYLSVLRLRPSLK